MLFAAAVLYLALLTGVASLPQRRMGDAYAVMLDAGSSGTRAHTYSWPSTAGCQDRLINKLVVEEGEGFAIQPGLSAFAANISGIAAYMEPVVNAAMESVPVAAQSSTPIYLQATAGLRLLPVAEQDAILREVRDVFDSSPFLSGPESALVVTGAVEGANEWTSVNYLRGTLGSPAGGNDSNSTALPAGVLGMGGASTQIAFVPLQGTDLKAGGFPIHFDGGDPFELYVHSFLGLGATEAQVGLQSFLAGELSVVDDPCLLRGFSTTSPVGPGGGHVNFEGSGDFHGCIEVIRHSLINRDAPCPTSPCSFDGVYQPDLSDGGLVLKTSFYQLAAFLFTAEFFDLAKDAPLRAMERAGQRFCELDWEDAQSLYPDTPPAFLANYCFSSMFFVQLLHHGYGIPKEGTPLRWADAIEGVGLDWPLGATLRATCDSKHSGFLGDAASTHGIRAAATPTPTPTPTLESVHLKGLVA
jgi:Golgi nucleoside diphosphatase